MRDIEFYTFLLENWSEFILINGLSFLFLFLVFRKVLVGGIFDPLFLVFIVGFSTNYAVVIFLYMHEYIKIELFLMVAVYAFIFIAVFICFSKVRVTSLFSRTIGLAGCKSTGKYEFQVALLLYLIISLYILSKIGFGLFSETNRFENNRGFGAFVRLLDLFSVFIIAYAALMIMRIKQSSKRILFWFLLVLFVLYSAMINGAKISIVFSLITVILALRIDGYKVKVGLTRLAVFSFAGIFFMIIALKINLVANNIDVSAESEHISGVPLVAERLLHRVVANANTSYLLLPNDVVYKIEKDNAIIRLFTSVVGITQMSKLLGYNVGDFSVGRQALLYYSPNMEVAGGPTSHFDLFSFVYFGFFGGLLSVGFFALLLGVINNEIRRHAMRRSQSNFFVSALLATIWVRAVIVIVEPTIGLAYLTDLFVVFLFLMTFLGFLKHVSRT